MADLAAYLHREAGRPFALGAADCATLAADWTVARCGVDPLAEIRDRGYCAAGPINWLPVARQVARAMRAAGIRLTRDPQPRDVAIVIIGGVAAGAIRMRSAWIIREEYGLAMVPLDIARVVAAWKLA